jgi:hypothetical protein
MPTSSLLTVLVFVLLAINAVLWLKLKGKDDRAPSRAKEKSSAPSVEPPPLTVFADETPLPEATRSSGAARATARRATAQDSTSLMPSLTTAIPQVRKPPVARRPHDEEDEFGDLMDFVQTNAHAGALPYMANGSFKGRTGDFSMSAFKCFVVGRSGKQKGNRYQLHQKGITVGRHPSCNIVLDDPRVSSRHAWVGMVDGKPTLRDLKSTNGTFLNVRTKESVGEAELVPGDTIFFGSQKADQFVFTME